MKRNYPPLFILSVVALLGMPSAVMAQEVGTRDNPIPLGETARVGDWEIEVVQFTPDAFDELSAEYEDIDAPQPDHQYAMVRFSATYHGDGVGKVVLDLMISAVGASNVGYDYRNSCPVIPDIAVMAPDVFSGGTVEFNDCWSVKSSDVDSLTAYLKQVGEDPIVFFALNGEDPGATPSPASSPTNS